VYWLERVKLIDRADDPAADLPYGDQRRLEIARAMCTNPHLLCLDEPAAGLNPRESALLNDLLQFIRKEHGTSILLIEHDMGVVMEISDHVVVLDYGEKISDGNAEFVRNDPKVIAAYLGVDDEEELAAVTGAPVDAPATEVATPAALMSAPVDATGDQASKAAKKKPSVAKAKTVGGEKATPVTATAKVVTGKTGSKAKAATAPVAKEPVAKAKAPAKTGAVRTPAAKAPAKTVSKTAATPVANAKAATIKAKAPAKTGAVRTPVAKAPAKTVSKTAATPVANAKAATAEAKAPAKTGAVGTPAAKAPAKTVGKSAATPVVNAKATTAKAKAPAKTGAVKPAMAKAAKPVAAAKTAGMKAAAAPKAAKPAGAKSAAVKPAAAAKPAKAKTSTAKPATAVKPAAAEPAELSGQLAAPRGGQADNLTRIKGIGKVNEAKLHGHGIYHFDQIAAWKAADVKAAEAYLAFDGRIQREDWVSQAKVLAKGGDTEFSKRVDKGAVASSRTSAGPTAKPRSTKRGAK
jgi:branched-chain amino acid transport system ATP-binding protein